MKLTTYVGDSLRFSGIVKQRAGSRLPLDITGCAVEFKAVLVSGTSIPLELEKAVGTGVTIVDGPAGSFTVDITPDDTALVGPEGGTFNWSVRVTVDPLHVHTVSIGTLTVEESL